MLCDVIWPRRMWWMICDVWDWSCSCNRIHDLHVDEYDNRQEPIGVVLIYCMTCVSLKTPCNYFTLLLTVSHSSRSNSWRDNFMKTRWWRSWWWRSWCHAGDKMIMEPQDGDQRSYMILAISCHYYLIACDVYHVFASYLLRTTVVNKMIPH